MVTGNEEDYTSTSLGRFKGEWQQGCLQETEGFTRALTKRNTLALRLPQVRTCVCVFHIVRSRSIKTHLLWHALICIRALSMLATQHPDQGSSRFTACKRTLMSSAHRYLHLLTRKSTNSSPCELRALKHALAVTLQQNVTSKNITLQDIPIV